MGLCDIPCLVLGAKVNGESVGWAYFQRRALRCSWLKQVQLQGCAVNLGSSGRPEEQWPSTPWQDLTLSLPHGLY